MTELKKQRPELLEEELFVDELNVGDVDDLTNQNTVRVYLGNQVTDLFEKAATGKGVPRLARKMARRGAADFLGENDQYHTSRFNSPGNIDAFLKQWLNIKDRKATNVLQATFLRMYDEALDVAKAVGNGAIAEEYEPALEDILHRYSQLLVGYPPELDEIAI